MRFIRHRILRKRMKWGTYGKSGKEPLRWMKLHCMTNEHIQAILDTQCHINRRYRRSFKCELRFRKKFPEYSIKETMEFIIDDELRKAAIMLIQRVQELRDK